MRIPLFEGCNSKDGIVPRLAHMPLGYNSDISFKYMCI